MKKVIQQQQRDWWAEVRVRQRDWLYAGLLRNQAACGPLRCFDVCQRARGKCCFDRTRPSVAASDITGTPSVNGW